PMAKALAALLSRSRTKVPTIWDKGQDGSPPIGKPALSLYINMPDDARCVFSLNAEITAKRHLRLRLPERQAEVWDEGRIQEKVNNIRDHYPFESRRVAAIDTWEDLFEYFDAHDLWHQGAWNLRRVIERIYQENEQ
ncbi:hypothetical protein QBC46DRAFT_234211, partial [Diplogelasinospora grovesii]